ncbi:hypothetical protein [Dictyobacter arantiisoli]|uniref:ATP-grasp domain-containing protein n=1 Tax=Dictyobacter arantiisoli TaxID=2014874 RepID=A0A5A5TBP8_9CHLR|nr:hypothetical protein [Dictyobacter arantiisoli]GCF08443.1 hypothetical protein KDI_20070 [Dictyobacter arantiisoli]
MEQLSVQINDTSLFATALPRQLGIAFHNIGSGVLRASNPEIILKIKAHYGERCGHIPWQCDHVRLLVTEHTPAAQEQIAYQSQLFGKQMQAATIEELIRDQQDLSLEQAALIVPYINVPEDESWLQQMLPAESWGLPGQMVSILKNKADFYCLLDDYALPDFQAPDYRIAPITNLIQQASDFLKEIAELYRETNLTQYPLGIMLRAAESDGNYGCCLLYQRGAVITLVPNGDVSLTSDYMRWPAALAAAQQHLLATMDISKETRIVLSRYIEFADSPGMSMVIMQGQIASLRWNGQIQKEGSKACVGTTTYQPQNALIAQLRQEYEDQTIACFEQLLRLTARKCQVEFNSLCGLANIDIMLPGPLEEELLKQRGQKATLYIAECNPRWTNYTDAIMSILGANREIPTINTMRATIQRELQAFDKYELPATVDPRRLRDRIAEADEKLKYHGTRIICRMPKNPLGVIFAGDVAHAQRELIHIIQELATS